MLGVVEDRALVGPGRGGSACTTAKHARQAIIECRQDPGGREEVWYGAAFARVATGSRIVVLRTPPRAPRANATCERFLGSVRRECLDHLLVLGEAHLRRVLRAYVTYFNTARPHQSLQQRIPDRAAVGALRPEERGPVRAVPVLGGLHHTYGRAA